MEFIQWRTQGLNQETHEPVGEVTHCALFKFNKDDLELLSEDMLLEIDKQMKEHEGDYVPNSGFKYLWIAEDYDFNYKWQCIKTFADIIGAEPEIYRD